MKISLIIIGLLITLSAQIKIRSDESSFECPPNLVKVSLGSKTACLTLEMIRDINQSMSSNDNSFIKIMNGDCKPYNEICAEDKECCSLNCDTKQNPKRCSYY